MVIGGEFIHIFTTLTMGYVHIVRLGHHGGGVRANILSTQQLTIISPRAETRTKHMSGVIFAYAAAD
jgi:hypothetical protein